MPSEHNDDFPTSDAESKRNHPLALGGNIVSRNVSHLLHNPLDEFIGKFNSGVPDAAENHACYIGEALLKEMRDQED